MRKLGFTDTETELSIAKLAGATHDVAKAQDLEAMAADLSRRQHESLGEATQTLVLLEAGRFRGLGQLGVKTSDLGGRTDAVTVALQRLQSVVGGAAQANMGTLAGKLEAVHAQADKLEVELGTALIPKIETLASGSVTAVQDLEGFNRATGGVAGKVALIAAATPIAVFALRGLATAGIAAAGAFGIDITTLRALTIAEDQATVAAGVLGTGLSFAGAAATGAAVGLATYAATTAILDRVAGSTKPDVDGLRKSFLNLAQAHVVDGVAASALGTHFQKLAGDLRTIKGSTFEKGFGLSSSSHQAVKDIDATNQALEALIVTAGPAKAKHAFGEMAAALIADGVSARVVGQEFGPFLDQLNQAEITASSAAGGIEKTTNAADAGRFAFLGLGAAVKTAADAFAAIDDLTTGPILGRIAKDKASLSFLDAVAALHDKGGASGGGSSQSPTAAALEQAQKELTLRDARRSVEDATRGVTDAENALTQAHKDETLAVTDLHLAQENLRTVLHGVARDSLAAKTATDALASAQNSAAGARLDVKDAQRALALAKSDARLNQFGVVDAAATLTADRQSGASAEQLLKDEVALHDAHINASAGNEAVKRAELALSDARLAAKGKTKDLTEANRQLNGTLHGFPKNSNEAKDAQKQLTDAQTAARAATDQVATAQRGLATAIDQVATAALGLERAQADVKGLLDAVGGGVAGAKHSLGDFITKMDDVASAAITMGETVRANAAKATHSVAAGFFAELTTLQAAVDAEPLLGSIIDPILDTIRRKYEASAIKESPASISFGGQFAQGGMVPGPLGKPTWAIVHGGETVVPASSLARSRPWTGGETHIHLTVQSLDPRASAPLVIKALESYCAGNTALPRTIRTAG